VANGDRTSIVPSTRLRVRGDLHALPLFFSSEWPKVTFFGTRKVSASQQEQKVASSVLQLWIPKWPIGYRYQKLLHVRSTSTYFFWNVAQIKYYYTSAKFQRSHAKLQSFCDQQINSRFTNRTIYIRFLTRTTPQTRQNFQFRLGRKIKGTEEWVVHVGWRER
jgi:hypothetical protein